MVQENDEGNDSYLSSPTLEQIADGGNLEYKVIPWGNASNRDPRRSKDLKVNLALWWLYMMASVSSNIKEQYQPLKDTAKPTFFGESEVDFALSEILRNTRPQIPIRPHKPSRSAFLDDQTASHTINKEYSNGCGRPESVMKRSRIDGEVDGNRRRTRSVAATKK